MKKLSFWLALVLIFGVALPTGVQAEASVKGVFGGHTYAIYEQVMDWDAARQYCESMGGHLVTITSAEEQQFLEELMVDCPAQDYLIGMHRKQGNLRRWVTGEPVTYENWGDGEPDNAHGGQDVVIFANGERKGEGYRIRRGQWDDESNRGPFICEWEYAPFTKESNGWPVVNADAAFGYGEDYKIPVKRYADTFGISVSSLVVSGVQRLFQQKGNCFGMSLLALAQYYGQVNLKELFPAHSGWELYQFGYQDIVSLSSGDIFSLAGNAQAIAAVERAQLSQNSQEWKKAEVFSGDPSYGQLLEFLSQDVAKPLLVTLNYGVGGHTLVIRNDIKPVEQDVRPGCYYIPVYDCNQPAASDLLPHPHAWYSQQSSRLMLDTATGEWSYWRNGVREATNRYRFLQDTYIRFYDVSRLNQDFYTKTLHLPGDWVKISFESRDFSVRNSRGQTLFQAVNGQIEQQDGACRFLPFAEGDGFGGILELPAGEAISCTLQKGSMLVWSNQMLAGCSSESSRQVTVDPAWLYMAAQAAEGGQGELVVQRGTDSGYQAVRMKGEAEKGSTCSLLIQDGVLSAEGEGSFSWETETIQGTRSHGIRTPKEVSGLELKTGNEITSFGGRSSAWARETLEEAAQQGLVPERFYGMDLTQQINRGEFAAVAVALYEALTGEQSTGGATPVRDVAGTVHQEDVERAYRLGITAGATSTAFEPDALITREQLAAMLCRTVQKYSVPGWELSREREFPLDTAGAPQFADDALISDYAKPAVAFLAKRGWVLGVDETRFAPRELAGEEQDYGRATREQAIAIAFRIYQSNKGR